MNRPQVSQLDFLKALEEQPSLLDIMSQHLETDVLKYWRSKRARQMELKFDMSVVETESCGCVDCKPKQSKTDKREPLFPPTACEKVIVRKRYLPSFRPDRQIWSEINHDYYVNKKDGWMYYLDRKKGEFRPVSKSDYDVMCCPVAPLCC